jgi:hypothetical protein
MVKVIPSQTKLGPRFELYCKIVDGLGMVKVATVTPKKNTPGGLGSGDVIPRVLAVAEDIYTVINPEPVNALLPILVTEFGIVTDDKLIQFWNALSPTLVTELPNEIVNNLIQLRNAS